MAAVLPLECK